MQAHTEMQALTERTTYGHCNTILIEYIQYLEWNPFYLYVSIARGTDIGVQTHAS